MSWDRRQPFRPIIARLLCPLFVLGALIVSRDIPLRRAAHTLQLPICSDGSFYSQRDWWDCPEKLPQTERVFNKSILYLKPHKTGSETFKQILIQISNYYNLTNDIELDRELQKVSTTRERRALFRKKYDILLRHLHYRVGATESRIRGWDEREFQRGEDGSPPKRQLLKIVTIRNPVDRLFSHYFSQRRFRSFVPRRGNVRKGEISEEEEIEDFREWLVAYPFSHQVRYNTDQSRKNFSEVGSELKTIRETVDFYDHIVVADQWSRSVCLFGFSEKINPGLLGVSKRNSNGYHARRFNVSSVLADSVMYSMVLEKIQYDFLYYQALFAKYTKKLEQFESDEMSRYCKSVLAK